MIELQTVKSKGVFHTLSLENVRAARRWCKLHPKNQIIAVNGHWLYPNECDAVFTRALFALKLRGAK